MRKLNRSEIRRRYFGRSARYGRYGEPMPPTPVPPEEECEVYVITIATKHLARVRELAERFDAQDEAEGLSRFLADWFDRHPGSKLTAEGA